MMISRLKNELPSVLTGKILSGDVMTNPQTGEVVKMNPLDLLEESPEIRQKRKQKEDEVRMVQEALSVLDREIVDFSNQL
jgi:hypothetical protein